MDEESAPVAGNRVRSAADPVHLSTHRGFVAGVVADDGRIWSGRREIVITDHGTGAAEMVAATMLVDESEVERLAPGGDSSTHHLDPLHIELWPAENDDDVTLIDETREPESRRLVVERDWVADRLLKRFTHDRLAPAMPGPLLHGGAVSTADGSTALVLGPSGTGKSTLIAHLAHAGCELINDEQVSVHLEAGLLGGFTRPIDIKSGGVAHLPPVDGSTTTRDGKGALVTARQLGTRHRLTGTPALLVLPKRDERDAGCEVDVLHPAESLEVLCANNLDLARDPVVALEAFAWLAATVPMVVLRYGDAATGAAVVVDRLRAHKPPDAVSWEIIAPGFATDEETAGNSSARRPSPQVVTVHIDDRTVLYDGATRGVARLNPAGSLTWRRLLAGAALDDSDQRLMSELESHGIVAPATR